MSLHQTKYGIWRSLLNSTPPTAGDVCTIFIIPQFGRKVNSMQAYSRTSCSKLNLVCTTRIECSVVNNLSRIHTYRLTLGFSSAVWVNLPCSSKRWQPLSGWRAQPGDSSQRHFCLLDRSTCKPREAGIALSDGGRGSWMNMNYLTTYTYHLLWCTQRENY